MAPAKEQNNKPEEIRAALDALRLYQASGMVDEDYAQELKKYLPPLAMKMGKQGTAVTADTLLAEIEQGPGHFQKLLDRYNKPPSQKRTYEEIVRNFPPPLARSGEDALYQAASTGDLERVKTLMDSGLTLYTNFALARAVESGHLPVVKYLVENSPDENERSLPPLAALVGATKADHLDIVKYLVEQGADINARDGYVVRLAAAQGHQEILEHLVEKGGDLQAVKDYALNGAAANGHLKTAKYLVQQGADIHANREQALRQAALHGHLGVLKFLVEQGADLRAFRDEAFEQAVENGHLEVVKYLIGKGVDIHARDMDALKCAAQSGHLEVLKYVIEQGADLETYGVGALTHAIDNDHFQIVQYLIEEQKVDFITESKAVLGLAAYNNKPVMAAYLIRQGADDSELDQLPQNAKKDIARVQAWHKRHPDAEAAERLFDLSPHYFKPAAFKAVQAMLEKESYSEKAAARYAYHISGLFGSEDRVLQYLEKWGEAGKQPLHDIAHRIQIPQEGRFDVKAWGDAVLQHGPKLGKYVKFAGKVPRPAKDAAGKGWSYTNTKEKIAEHAFKKGYENPALAAFCLDHGWDEDDFKTTNKQIKKYQKQYVANDNHKTAGRIPHVAIDGKDFGKDGYRFYKLPDGDLRGLLLGEFTNCCQHIGGVGADCAKHGFRSEEGGFYVVADKKADQIVGQSWAWRGEKGELVLDSLESLSGHFNAQSWESLLTKFARKALEDKKAAISAVHVGQGGATPLLSFKKAAEPAQPVDYSGYRDSKKQYVVKPARPINRYRYG